MGKLVSVNFRGEERDVEIGHHYSPDPETGAGPEIDWHFYGLDPAAHNALQMTDAENEAIFQKLADVLEEDDRAGDY